MAVTVAGNTDNSGASARLARLHVITDASLQARFGHAELARLALAGGAGAVQLREKRAWTTRALVEVARAVTAACSERGAACIVNDRLDVALAAGAHGVHVGREDLDPAVARRLLGSGALVGATVHDQAELAALEGAAVDYLGVGPVFGTRSKDTGRPPLGLDRLARIARAATAPVIAIGDITPERVAPVLAAGAFGVAVLSGVCLAADPEDATRRYREAIAAALASGTRA